jgi:hypothetical protein
LGAVDDVKAGNPQHNDCADHKRCEGDVPGHSEPCTDGRLGNDKAQIQMAKEREPLSIRVTGN